MATTQLGPLTPPTIRAADPRALMLDHDRRDLRQLLNLVTHQLTDRDPLRIAEHVPAPARHRPMHHDLIDRDRFQQLAAMPLMTRLAALALTRPPLRPRRLASLPDRRRITRRRPRRVPRALGQLTLQTIHPSGQLPDLAIHPQQHLDHHLATRVIDRLSLSPLHALKFDRAVLCPPDQLNAYGFFSA